MSDSAASDDASATGYALLMVGVEESVQAAADQIATLNRVVENGFAGMRALTPAPPPRPARRQEAASPALPPSGPATPPAAPLASASGPIGQTPAASLAVAPGGTIKAALPPPPAGPGTAPGPTLAPMPPASVLDVPLAGDDTTLTAAPEWPDNPVAPAAVTLAPIAPAAIVAANLPAPLAPIPGAAPPAETGAGSAAPTPAAAGGGGGGPTHGDVFLDGTRVGTWMSDHLARAAASPARGITGFDPRLGPRWPGALQGG